MVQKAIGQWRHVFKLDPDRPITDEALEQVCLSGTDAVIIGGSSGITYDNTMDLFVRVRRYALPCILEISSDEALVPGFDLYFVPVVLNTDRAEWIVGKHREALREFGSFLNWDLIVAEGYVIANGNCTAAKLTEAGTPDSLEDMLAYARLADRLLRLPIFYMEYSGVFGNMEWVSRVKGTLKQARLFYGGGIDSPAKAAEAARAAHTVVVGNAVYTNLPQAVATVGAVKEICL